MILVLGGSGTVGGEVARQLVAASQPVRLLLRDPSKAKAFGNKVEAVTGDLNKPESLLAGMRGVERLFLVSNGPDIPKQDANVVQAAKQAGVKHIVKLSALGAAQPNIALGRWHSAGEQAVIHSGLAWNVLRPSGFASNSFMWLATIKRDNSVYMPVGDGRAPSIDPQDIAAVAVLCLTKPEHAGQAFDLTGPEALTTKEEVDILAKACGRPLKFVDIPPEAARQGMLKAGVPPPLTEAILELYALIKAGHTATVLPTVEKVLGRKAQTYAAWAQRNAKAFA